MYKEGEFELSIGDYISTTRPFSTTWQRIWPLNERPLPKQNRSRMLEASTQYYRNLYAVLDMELAAESVFRCSVSTI